MPKRNNSSTSALAQVFRILGDGTRLSIVQLLWDRELNVSTICKKLGMAQPSVSHHLGILRMGGLVNTRRDGKEIHYSLREFDRDGASRALRSMLNGSQAVRIGPFVMALAKD